MEFDFFLKVVPFLFIVGSLCAQPAIEFDTKEFDCGSFVEGTKDKIEAVFTIKNNGNEDLKLLSVKPSCGCTVVKFDSLVQPGKSTKINSTVNIKGKRAGVLSKAITVRSNAENDSIVRLIIKATVLQSLSPSVSFIDMTGDDPNIGFSLQLVSSRNDLKISTVSFVPVSTGRKPDNIPVAPYNVTFSMIPTDTTRSDGMTTYRLELSPVKAGFSEGDFVLATNHPEKKELRIKGKVNATANQTDTTHN